MKYNGTAQCFLGARKLGSDVMAGPRDVDVGCCPGAWVRKRQAIRPHQAAESEGRQGGKVDILNKKIDIQI
jgi:hypothetical protein